MPLDPETYGLLVGNDICDPFTAAVASTTSEPQPQAPTKRHPVAVILAAVAAIITFILIRTF
jgi:hypothetical protein